MLRDRTVLYFRQQLARALNDKENEHIDTRTRAQYHRADDMWKSHIVNAGKDAGPAAHW